LFSKENKREVPIVGIAISSVLASVLMLMNYAQGLAETFKFIILLSTFSVLLPYLMANVSLVWISIRLKLKWKWGFILLAIIGFLFSMLAIYGCGKEAFYYGILLLLAGFPIYIWMKRNKKGDNSKPNNST
jgi:APA family basic amino acid/polyamine antiporter